MGNWSITGNLNTARNHPAGFGVQISAVIAGGNYSGDTQATTEKFNGTVWANGNNLNVPRGIGVIGTGTASAGMAAGGAAQTTLVSLDSTEKYDGTNWTTSGTLNVARRMTAGCGTQTAALATGGEGAGSTNLSSSETFDGTSWITAASMAAAKMRHGCAGSQSSSGSFGGALTNTSNGADAVSTNYVFNGTTFSTGGALSTAVLNNTGCGDSSSSALCFTGKDTSNTVTAAVQFYNGTAWATEASLLTAKERGGRGGNVTSGLCVGGVDGAVSNVAVTEKFQQAYMSAGSQTVIFSNPAHSPLPMFFAPVKVVTFSAPHPTLLGIPGIVQAGVVTATFNLPQSYVQRILIQAAIQALTFSQPAATSKVSVTVLAAVQTINTSAPSTVVIAKQLLISVSNFPSGKTVSYKIQDDSGNVVQNWTSAGVNELVVDATAGKSIYYLTTNLISGGFQGFVMWKTNDATPLTAVGEINYFDSMIVSVSDKTNTNNGLLENGTFGLEAINENVLSRLASASYSAPDNAGIAAILSLMQGFEKWKNNKMARISVVGTLETWVIYDDDNITPLLTFTHDTSTKVRTKAT